jgi:hypothetical protein
MPEATPVATAPTTVTTEPPQAVVAPESIRAAPTVESDPRPEVVPPTPTSTSAATPEPTTAEPQQSIKLGGFAAAGTPSSEAMPEALPTPAPPTSVAAVEPQPIAKSEVEVATPPTPSPEAMPETHPALPELEAQTTAEPQKEVILGAFKEPEAQASEVKPDIEAVLASSTPLDDGNNGPREGCSKNVSVGSMGQGKLILATPEWMAMWIERNQKKFPGVCFSDSPMSAVQNYLIVFSTSAPHPPGMAAETIATASVKQVAPAPGMGTFTTSQGSTWHYTFDNIAAPTVTTIWAHDAPHNLLASILYATAYSEQGIPVSQHWPGQTTKRPQRGREEPDKAGLDRSASPAANHMMSDLMVDVIGDIAKHAN